MICRSFHWQDRDAWDAFVRSHPHGSPFHLIAWRETVRQTFGYAPKYRLVIDQGEIVGVLPLFVIENFMTGRILMSTPFAVYGGILAKNAAARVALEACAREMAARMGVQYLELRNSHEEQRSGFGAIDRYATFTKVVAPGSPDELLARIPQKTRNLVRKALKHPYQSRITRDLSTFYKLLVRSYRKHGTPVFPLRFFETICANFGTEVDVREILIGDQVVASSMNFFFNDQMHTYYAASAPEALPMAPNNFMYFDHLLWAGNNGLKQFDFGRSKVDSGPYHFKKHWGTEMRPLPYEVMLVKREELPNFTPKNPKFALATKVWQRIPVPVTKVLGPALVALFP